MPSLSVTHLYLQTIRFLKKITSTFYSKTLTYMYTTHHNRNRNSRITLDVYNVSGIETTRTTWTILCLTLYCYFSFFLFAFLFDCKTVWMSAKPSNSPLLQRDPTGDSEVNFCTQKDQYLTTATQQTLEPDLDMSSGDKNNKNQKKNWETGVKLSGNGRSWRLTEIFQKLVTLFGFIRPFST